MSEQVTRNSPITGIGVIGCGGMGHALLRRIVASSDQVRVAAVFDPDHSAVDATIEMLGRQPVICTSHQEVSRHPDVDWVMIASPNHVHCEQVLEAFAGGRHVFCQKPLGINLDECIRMRDAWVASGKMFTIGFTLRYSAHYRKIRELLQAGSIGDLISIEFNETLSFNHGGYIMGNWRRFRANAGTHLLEKCCHDIDLANWMVGAPAARVASFGGLNFFRPENAGHIERIGPDTDGNPAYQTWRQGRELNPFTSDKDIVDNQVAIIEYANGVRASFHTNINSGIPERRMVLVGSEGAIRADVLPGTIELGRIGFDAKIQDCSTAGRGGHGGGDDVLAGELLASMLDGTPPSAGIEEGLRAALTCFAIDEAMDSGQVVAVDSYWQRAGL